MARFGCFEIRTTCDNCGQAAPVNGPLRSVLCTACFQPFRVPEKRITEFFNDLEEEYEGLEEKQGTGGTLMSERTYNYKCFRLTPRCEKCKTPFPDIQVGYDGVFQCQQCATQYVTYPAPDWVKAGCPSAVQIIAGERESTGDGQGPQVQVNQQKPQPVMMACPQCGAGLSISADLERTCNCQYCSAQVYIPDEIWKRLHPIKEVTEWFVRFEGPNKKQLDFDRRQRDLEEEARELKNRGMSKTGPKERDTMFWVMFLGIPGLIILISVGTAALYFVAGYFGYTIVVDEETLTGGIGGIVGGIVAIGAVGYAIKASLGAKFGNLKQCKDAMAAIARKHRLEHYGAEYAQSLGTVRGEIKGRDVEIDPDDDYAIEVDLDDCFFFLQTEPPSYPRDGLYRFTSGDARFDRTFPIRYAEPHVAERLQQSHADLAPINWFLDRWGPKLARMKLDSSDVAVHLLPGGVGDRSSTTRYLLAQDMEPLLNDMIVLAKALEALYRGKPPELPGSSQQAQAQHPHAQHPQAQAQQAPPPGQYPQTLAQGQYPQGQYPQGQYPQGQHPQAQGQYPQAQGQYPPGQAQAPQPQAQHPNAQGQQQPQVQFPDGFAVQTGQGSGHDPHGQGHGH